MKPAYILFLSVYFILYGGIHLYFLEKLKNAFNFPIVYAFLFSLLIILSPVFFHISEGMGMVFLAKIFAYIGYTWMGIIFLFFCSSLLIDICRIFVHIPPQISFFVPFFLAICISIYGYFEAENIRIERIVIKTQKLPKKIESLKIAQISDLHLGIMTGKKRLNKIINLIKEADPDILISTGDLVDADPGNLDIFSALLRELNPKYGKYAVTGNHEIYAGLEYSIRFTEESGFRVLRNEFCIVEDFLALSGVDDSEGRMFNPANKDIKQELLIGIPKDKFVILLKHRPDVEKDSIGLFDLQLSGHTHKGQIFPFHLIVRLFYPKYCGFWTLQNNSYLYVSRGAGTWGPLCRFLASPEITLIELYSQQ